MAQEAPTATSDVPPLEDLDFVVDADAHVIEAVDDFLPYMADEFEVIRDRVEMESHPRRSVYSLSKASPSWYADLSGGEGERASDSYRRQRTHTGEMKLSEMDSFGITHSIVQPTLNLGINTVNNPQYAVALANAYNAWIADEFLDRHEHIKACIVVAPKRPARAAEEIDRWADEEDFVGVGLATSALIPPAGDPTYDPIYAAAEDHGLPIVHHGTTYGMDHHFPMLHRWIETNAEDVALSHPFQTMSNFVTTMFRGVPERFPDLDIVFQEAGLAWLPYFMWRLDDQYLTKGAQIPYLDRLPSEYVGEQVYITTQPVGHTARNPEHLAWAIEMCGPEAVMFAADLPHPAFDPPNELYNRIASYFDGPTVRKIMGETAADLFGLEPRA